MAPLLCGRSPRYFLSFWGFLVLFASSLSIAGVQNTTSGVSVVAESSTGTSSLLQTSSVASNTSSSASTSSKSSETSTAQITPAPSIGNATVSLQNASSTVDKSAYNCSYDVYFRELVWGQQAITTVAAATVMYIRNNATNTTRTTTIFNATASSYWKDKLVMQTNDAGTHIYTAWITDGLSNSSYSTVV